MPEAGKRGKEIEGTGNCLRPYFNFALPHRKLRFLFRNVTVVSKIYIRDYFLNRRILHKTYYTINTLLRGLPTDFH